MALENYTLNTIFDLFKSTVAKHEMLQGFGIEENPTRGYSKEQQAELDYPYCFINPGRIGLRMNTSGAGIAAVEFTINVFVADKQYDNASNSQDILSDTAQILMDLTQWISTHPDLRNIQLRVDPNLDPVQHGTISNVHGWETNFVLRVPHKLCYNKLPIDNTVTTC